MNILITGGAGFIGSNLALSLLKRGHQVVILDNLSHQVHGTSPENTSPLYKSIKDACTFIYGDVRNEEDWRQAMKGIELIVHLAAETGTGQSMYHINHYAEVNTLGTARMLNILANEKTPVKKVVVASSRAIYGEGKYFSEELGYVYPGQRLKEQLDIGNFEVNYPGAVRPLQVAATDEDSKIHPSSVYGITKQNQEQLVMCVCQSLGIDPVAFRYQNVYGPGQSLTNPYTGILSIFSAQIKSGKGINIFEDGNESRDFVYIDDVVEATVLGIENAQANGAIFNVGSGVATSVSQVAASLLKYYNIQVPVTVSGNYRMGDIRHNFADISKIKRLLGFSPEIDFETGVQQFTRWADYQHITDSGYEAAINEMKKKGLFK